MCVREREGGGGRSPIPSLQPAGPQPLTSPRRCTIARCHRCPLRILSRQRKMPGVPAVRTPTSARPRPPYPPRQPRQARLPTWWLAVSGAAVPHPLLLLCCYIARSAMFPVSPGARRATTTGWVGARGRGPAGRGGRQSQSFLLSTRASPSY